MQHLLRIVCVVGLTVAWGNPAPAQLLLDDFTTGSGFTAQGGPSTYRSSADGLDPARTLGGHRSFFVQSCLHPSQGTLPIEHDPAAGTIAVGGTEVSQWCEGVGFGYGDDFGTDGEPLDLDLAAAGVSHLEIDLLTFDRGDPAGVFYQPTASLDMSTRYTFTTSTGSSFESYAYQFFEFPLPEVDQPTTVRVPLDEILLTAEGEYDPTNIDSIGFYTGGTGPGAELVISEIRLVGGSATLAGDYNGDGFVSQTDLDLVLLNWGDDTLPAGWVATNLFDGGLISQNELDGVLLNWGDGTPPTPGITSAVPEPGVGLVVGAGLWAVGRRRAKLAGSMKAA